MTVTDRLTNGMQENLITMLAYSDEHGKIVANLVDAQWYEGIYRIMAERLINHQQKHGKAPGKAHTADLFNDILDTPGHKHLNAVKNALLSMWELSPSINIKYVLDTVTQFIRQQTFKIGITQAAEVINRGGADPEEVNAEVQKVISSLLHTNKATFDSGISVGDLDHLMKHLKAREQNEFDTGIPELDRRHVVPTRGALMMLLGLSGDGKSWWLVHLGKRAARLGKRVVHVTLELSAGQVQERYWQAMHTLPTKPNHLITQVTRLQLNERRMLTSFASEEIKARFSLQYAAADTQRMQDLQQRKNHSIADLIKVKHFPTRSLTIPALRAYLDTLEAEGFIADLLLLDYAALMKSDADNYRISLGRLIEELRGLAGERNIALATVHQVNREGKKANQVGTVHIAEDWSAVCTADIVISLSRNEREKYYKLARLQVDKHRSGDQDFGVVISQNYPHGQFVTGSAPLYPTEYEDMLAGLD